MAEVELGNLATETAINADVKKFTPRMISDHGQSGEEPKAIAHEGGLSSAVTHDDRCCKGQSSDPRSR